MGRVKASPWGMLYLFVVVFAVALFTQVLACEVALDANTALLITAALYVLIFLVVFMLIRHGGERFSKIGLRISGLGTFILLAAVLGIIAQFIWAILLAVAAGHLAFDFGALQIGTFLFEVLVMALLVGFIEESAFRGYIQRKFTASYGFVRALILASFLFMFVHIQFYTYLRLYQLAGSAVTIVIQFSVTQIIITTFTLGIVTGYLYFKSKSIFPPAAFHIMLNVGGLLMLYSNASTIAFTLSYGSFAILWMFWAVVVGALVWVATKAIFPKKRV